MHEVSVALVRQRNKIRNGIRHLCELFYHKILRFIFHTVMKKICVGVFDREKHGTGSRSVASSVVEQSAVMVKNFFPNVFVFQLRSAAAAVTASSYFILQLERSNMDFVQN